MQDNAEHLVTLFTQRSTTLATCESLTGGGIGAAITDVPGSSAVYRGGIIAYATDVKTALADVDQGLVDKEGVVNELTAIQMALGAQARCGAEWAVSTTGVAGPTEVEGLPAGTVWLAVVGPSVGMSNRPQFTELKTFEGDRAAVRAQAVEHAIDMLLRVIDDRE